MPSDTRFTRVVDEDGEYQLREVVIVEQKKEEYSLLYGVYHSYKDSEGTEHSTNLKLTERKDGKVFVSIFKDDSRITMTLNRQEIAELYAVLMAYINRNYG